MFKVYGFNLKEIAMFAWMPMLFADLGCIVGGYLPPLFQRWFGVNLIVSRKMVVTMGALLMIGPGMIVCLPARISLSPCCASVVLLTSRSPVR